MRIDSLGAIVRHPVLMKAANYIESRLAGPRKWSEQKVILSLVSLYWLGIQLANFLYDVLDGKTETSGGGTLFSRWFADFIHPAEMAAVTAGAILSLAIYLALVRVKRNTLRSQILIAGAVTLVGTAAFGLACMEINRWLGHQATPNSFGLILLRWFPSFGLWSGIALTVTYNFEARARERRLAIIEMQAQEARVEALRYQVNPHLLYNTLNSIAALILDKQNDVAEDMVLRLSDFFRASLSAPSQPSVPLVDEIAFQKLYLTIEKLRFGDRLSYEFNVDPEAEQVKVPNLILQPLIENALKHGMSPDGHPTYLVVTAKRLGDEIQLDVSDNGPGSSPKNGLGIGLDNVKGRLKSHFGGAATFEAGQHELGFSVRITIPA